MLDVTFGPCHVTEAGTLQMGTVRFTPGPGITTKESAMRASFDNAGNLVLHPESTLERMAAKAFVLQMKTRAKPQILIDAGDGSAVPQTIPPGTLYRGQPVDTSVSLIAQESEDIALQNQQNIELIANDLGG